MILLAATLLVVLLVSARSAFAVCDYAEWRQDSLACVQAARSGEVTESSASSQVTLDDGSLAARAAAFLRAFGIESNDYPEPAAAPPAIPPANPAPSPVALVQERTESGPAVVNAPFDSVIVYSRVPRTMDTTVTTNGAPVEVEHLDIFDALPEVGFQFSGFSAPGQLVIRDEDGSEQIIYDCHTNWVPCVPWDSAVSLDGKKIAFALYRSNKLRNGTLGAGRTRPNWYLDGSGREAQIFVYTIATGELEPWPHTKGHHDTSPVWLPNGKMMFSSNRHGGKEPFMPRVNHGTATPSHIYMADADGSNAVEISPHELSGALHPYLLDNGRVAYNSKWLSHNLAYVETNGGINWPGTVENMWMVADMDHRGGDMTALLGAHRAYGFPKNGGWETYKALHFIGQRLNSDVCTGNYYRANNMALGDVFCFGLEPKLEEGPPAAFRPRRAYSAVKWSKSNDEPNFDGERNKLGWPEGTPDGQLIVSMGTGWCTTVAYDINNTPALITRKGQIGCDVGLYKTTNIPNDSIEDLEVIVDRPEWHEFNARVIRPRVVPIPELDNSDDGSCVIASSDAGSTDAHWIRGYRFNSMYKAMANNGGEIHGLPHAELAAIRFYEVVPNGRARVSNITGNNLKYIGDAPLLADKSFIAQVPCETPLLMAGVDTEGRIIKRDQIPMSLRSGEKRVCGGCHLHGSAGRPYEASLASSVSPIRFPAATPVPTWSKDISPLMQANCIGCHDLFGDYEKVTYDVNQKYALNPVAMRDDDRRWIRDALHRPATSKYVNSMFARESMLYWVAKGERTDGRTNEQYQDDLDYPTDHPPSPLSLTEIKLIARWIDGGYPK